MTPEDIVTYGEPLAPDHSRCLTTSTHKRCPKCETWLSHECFSKSSRDRFKMYSICRQCCRERKLRTLYGLTCEEFDTKLKEQGGKCLICDTSEPTGLGFVVDHSHKTGATRGILCHICNIAIGQLHDDPEIIDKTAEYLRKHE